MPTISVTNKHNQHEEFDNIKFTANSITQVDIFAWDKIKKTPHYHLDHLSADESRFSALMSEFRDVTFARFESQGEASLKASMTQIGTLTKPELLLAHEWLEYKNSEREARRDAREDEAISIARSASFAATAAAAAASEANAIARSNRRISIGSVIAAFIAAIAAIKWR